ncbi:MAG: cellulase [Candidimonas sp.]|nr:MAG: cellulase [Candidimonas sp.]TAM18672.1 MAG: cellulase [Candidimonas sp.]TAM74265.1 MAG: cellulase [Candidimonas sp.]
MVLIACAVMSAQAASLAAVKPGIASVTCSAWPRWVAFKGRFISADGRVIDVGSADARTVSEGQAYGLFLALVANDRPQFEKLLNMTQNILAQGDLTKHLPAWLWGKRSDGTWGVIDSNPASDADLWLAYTLLQAGHIWHERRFTALGILLARQVLSQETARLPGLGWSLLPSSKGFHPSPDIWRLNPSYLPLQVLRGLDAALPKHAKWRALIETTQRLLVETAPHGFSPDWAQYQSAKGKSVFLPDKATHALGSYNAIRVYLWLGMLDPADPDAALLLKTFRPMVDYVQKHGFPPETINTATGESGPNAGNAGFSAAMVPFLQASGEPLLAQAQAVRVAQLETQTPSGYYSQVLSLFGLGWQDGRFRFRANGDLWLAWQHGCAVEPQ